MARNGLAEVDAARCRLDVLDLQGRVMQVEAIMKETFQVASDGVAIVALAHQDVRGECGKVRPDLPYVQVVNAADARVRG